MDNLKEKIELIRNSYANAITTYCWTIENNGSGNNDLTINELTDIYLNSCVSDLKSTLIEIKSNYGDLKLKDIKLN